MIWLDITDPKYVLFFKEMIPLLKTLDSLIITTRQSEGYSECLKLLEVFKIEHYPIGGYGGSDKLGKLQARLHRQNGFLELFNALGEMPKLFITGASVEGVQTAYGLGIPVVNFADTPIAADTFSLDKITILSRLTLPLSTLIFRPFVVPQECYSALGIPAQNIIAYDFIDIALWLKDLTPATDFRIALEIDTSKPTILVREEEYKAHYVKQKLPIIYQSLHTLSQLDVELVVMPRYESNHLKEEFGAISNIHILEQKLQPNEFYPYIDLLIGGGGTMNLESTYLGIPTISTRSLFLFHDKVLLEQGLMHHAKSVEEVLHLTHQALQNFTPLLPKPRHPKREVFEKQQAGFTQIIQEIKSRFYP